MIFNVYKVIPYYEAISLDDIEKIKEYLENNGIYLKNENFIKDNYAIMESYIKMKME